MKQPFFSIGIPVYNAEKYLSECVDSILSQSFTDYELILVDDGSKDSSLSLCRAYAEKDSRVHVVTKENGGISSASNCALDHFRGEYAFFMDNDDTMCEDTLQKAFDGITAHQYPDILQCGYKQFSMGLDNLILTVSHPDPGPEYLTDNLDQNAAKLIIDQKCSSALWTKFFRLSFLLENNIRFQSQYDSAQDSDVSYRCLRKTSRISFCEFHTVNWIHPRDGSVSTTMKYKPFYNRCILFSDYIEDLPNWTISEELREQLHLFFARFIQIYSLEIFNMPKDDLFRAFDCIQANYKDHFKKLSNKNYPLRSRLILTLYNVIGIKNTARLLYFYLHHIKRT